VTTTPMPSSRSPWARIAATAAGSVGKPDRGDEAAQSEVAQGLLGGRWKCSDVRPVHAQLSAKKPCDQRTVGPTKRDRKRPGLHADQSDQQADRNPGGEEGDAGAIAAAQHVPNLCGGLLDVAGRAHKRHDVAELDFCFRRQRDLLASALQVTQNIPGASSPMRVTSSVTAQPCRAGTSTTTSKTSPDT
jgi:hypothetical protein